MKRVSCIGIGAEQQQLIQTIQAELLNEAQVNMIFYPAMISNCMTRLINMGELKVQWYDIKKSGDSSI